MDKWFIFGKSAAFDEGMRHAEEGRCAEAAAAFETCLEQPCEASIRRLASHYLCQALTRMSDVSMSQDSPLEAVSLLLKAVGIHTEYADLRLRLAIAYARAGDDESALEQCKEALRLNPLYAEAHTTMEAITLGRPLDGAIRSSTEKRIAAAKQAYKEGLLELSEAILNELTITHPTYADIRCLFAQVLLEMDRLEEAVTHLQHALRVNPKYADAWATLGIAWKRLGLQGESELAFKTALEINHLHPIASAESVRPNN